jgi:hypothetical protein
MSALVRLGAKMPADIDTNGLDDLVDELTSEPSTIRVAVCWFDVSKITLDTDSDAHIPTVRIRRFEPLGTVDAVDPAIVTAVQSAHQQRTGREPLPFDVVSSDDA